MSRPLLLIVHHSRSGSTASLADAVLAGARDELITGIEVETGHALDPDPEAVRRAAGIILGTPENFGYMSGAMKHFFDSVYYPCLDQTQGLPYGLFIKAGNDGQGALGAIERIVTGLRWRRVVEPLIVAGDLTDGHLEAAHELGMTFAAGLEAGLF